MYNDKITLTPQEILEHDFKIDARGYRPQEVDKYLDIIIKDYTEFDNIIKAYDKEYRKLTEENATLKAQIRKLQSDVETAKKDAENNKGVTNIDLLRRISKLEKAVFGKSE